MQQIRTDSPGKASFTGNMRDEPLFNDLYLALVADVLVNEPATSHRNLRIIGCFKTLVEANRAVNHYCVSAFRNNKNIRELEDAIPTLTFNESGGFVDIRQQFTDFSGNLLHLQRFWVQHFNCTGGGLAGNGRIAVPLYVVQRVFLEYDDDEDGWEDEDEETSHEEVVSVHTCMEDANKSLFACCVGLRSPRSCALSEPGGMEIEGNAFENDEGTWMASVQTLHLQFWQL